MDSDVGLRRIQPLIEQPPSRHIRRQNHISGQRERRLQEILDPQPTPLVHLESNQNLPLAQYPYMSDMLQNRNLLNLTLFVALLNPNVAMLQRSDPFFQRSTGKRQPFDLE